MRTYVLLAYILAIRQVGADACAQDGCLKQILDKVDTAIPICAKLITENGQDPKIPVELAGCGENFETVRLACLCLTKARIQPRSTNSTFTSSMASSKAEFDPASGFSSSINKHYINKHCINEHYINKHYINKHYINKHYINKHYINKHYIFTKLFGKLELLTNINVDSQLNHYRDKHHREHNIFQFHSDPGIGICYYYVQLVVYHPGDQWREHYINKLTNIYNYNDLYLIFKCILHFFKLIYLLKQHYQLLAIDVFFDKHHLSYRLFHDINHLYHTD
ncbi:hypothetical protein MCOR25_011118 [Pyricularia grisea]|nr:hypothetical protein MCOR25_011118 [Pyricularia grisea]